MNRRDLVLALADRADTDRRTADDLLSSLIDIITETVSTGEPVAVSGFAKFARVDRASLGKTEENLFTDLEPTAWHGRDRNVFCVAMDLDHGSNSLSRAPFDSASMDAF